MNEIITKKIRIAAYMRLSKADAETLKESNSISMQRLLIYQYIEAHFGVYQIVEYIDM